MEHDLKRTVLEKIGLSAWGKNGITLFFLSVGSNSTGKTKKFNLSHHPPRLRLLQSGLAGST